MRRCAFLTLADPANFVIDDALAAAPLAALGWAVDEIPWDAADVAWGEYELVVIRSPWDYQRDPPAFLARLEEIAARGARVENQPALARWNLDKHYLAELEKDGVPIVPTRYLPRLGAGQLPALFAELGADQIVLKPLVSASADGTYRIARGAAGGRADSVEAYFAQRPLMAQPFVPAVLEEGEYSLCYFNGVFSHAIRKTPRAGDFRVQEEHGGMIIAVDPPPALRAAAQRAITVLPDTPLYARVDLVAAPGDGYWLMELELVEPSLYLRMDAGAPQRFAAAIDARMAAMR